MSGLDADECRLPGGAPTPHWLYVGDTPLHLAAASLRGRAARLLLRHGGDPNATNRRRATPLHYACDPRPQSGPERGTLEPS